MAGCFAKLDRRVASRIGHRTADAVNPQGIDGQLIGGDDNRCAGDRDGAATTKGLDCNVGFAL